MLSGGSPSPISQINLGGNETTSSLLASVSDLKNAGFVFLTSGVLSQTGMHVVRFYKNGTAYTPPGTKLCRIFHLIYWQSVTTSTAGMFQLMADTVTFVDGAAISTLTAPKYESGTASQGIYQVPVASIDTHRGCLFDIANGTFGGVQTITGNAGFVTAIGIEI